MRILLKEPEEIGNPHENPYNLAPTQLRDIGIFYEGIQAVYDACVEVDMDKAFTAFGRLCLDKCPPNFEIGDCANCEVNHKTFSQYLKEQLEV